MGCGASKSQTNNVVETHSQSTSPVKSHAPPIASETPISPPEYTLTKPKTPPIQEVQVQKPAFVIPTTIDSPTNPAPQTDTAKTSNIPLAPIPPKKGEVIEVDLTPKVPTPVKSAVQERFEKYATERKMAALSRPTTANIERKLADAEERRKVQSEQKLKKVKLKNRDVEERGAQLKELEDRKAQELMLLIKNKNSNANQKRQAIQQEVKTRAEEESIKAREAAAKKSATQTPVDTPHDGLDTEESKKSILETPLPPL